MSDIDRAAPALYRSPPLHEILSESYLNFWIKYKIMWLELKSETQKSMGKNLG